MRRHLALNARIILDRYSPPHIEDFAQQLHGKRIFLIATPFGLFEAVNTMFGLCNAAQMCQRFVDEIVT